MADATGDECNLHFADAPLDIPIEPRACKRADQTNADSGRERALAHLRNRSWGNMEFSEGSEGTRAT
jgi:hypothetical protein